MFEPLFEINANGASEAELIGFDQFIDETGTGKILFTFMADVEGIPQQDLQTLVELAEEAITAYAVRNNLHVANTASIQLDTAERLTPPDDDISPWSEYLGGEL